MFQQPQSKSWTELVSARTYYTNEKPSKSILNGDTFCKGAVKNHIFSFVCF